MAVILNGAKQNEESLTYVATLEKNDRLGLMSLS